MPTSITFVQHATLSVCISVYACAWRVSYSVDEISHEKSSNCTCRSDMHVLPLAALIGRSEGNPGLLESRTVGHERGRRPSIYISSNDARSGILFWADTLNKHKLP